MQDRHARPGSAGGRTNGGGLATGWANQPNGRAQKEVQNRADGCAKSGDSHQSTKTARVAKMGMG